MLKAYIYESIVSKGKFLFKIYSKQSERDCPFAFFTSADYQTLEGCALAAKATILKMALEIEVVYEETITHTL